MSIEFSELLNTINSKVYSIPIFNTILSSVIYTSIILSILLIVILVFIYPCAEDTPSWAFAKIFIYLFIANTVIFSAHYSIMSNKYKEKIVDRASTDFITNINRRGGSIYDRDSIRVVPKFEERRINIPDECEQPTPSAPIPDEQLTVGDMLDRVEKAL
jgi:hypothetical protein